MIDRRIELRDRLISGLVKRNPNDHWNLKCDLNDPGGGAGGRVLNRRQAHHATAWLWITISVILIASSRCVCCWCKAMGDMKMEDREKSITSLRRLRITAATSNYFVWLKNEMLDITLPTVKNLLNCYLFCGKKKTKQNRKQQRAQGRSPFSFSIFALKKDSSY